MKNLILALVAVSFLALTGCTGMGINFENSEMATFTVESIAVPIGYYAAQSPDIDTGLREIYSLAKTGKLTPEGLNKILDALNTKDPLQIMMLKRALRLAEMAGATVELGQITDLQGINPATLEAIARGYVEGYDVYMLTR